MTDRQVPCKAQQRSLAVSLALQRRNNGRVHQARWAQQSFFSSQAQILYLAELGVRSLHMEAPVLG